MFGKRKSFFERLTGGITMSDDDRFESEAPEEKTHTLKPKSTPGAVLKNSKDEENWMIEEEEGQLNVDVYQTPTEIIVQTMVAGVRPEDLSITIARDMITVRGKREENKTITEDNFFIKELYWGTFSRTILLPQEVEPEEAEAIEKHGLLVIKMPKIDKEKKTSLRVKSL